MNTLNFVAADSRMLSQSQLQHCYMAEWLMNSQMVSAVLISWAGMAGCMMAAQLAQHIQ